MKAATVKLRMTNLGLVLVAVFVLATLAWSANRLDLYTHDPGNPRDAFDDWDTVSHPFIHEDLQPVPIYLYVDGNFNAIDPAVNLSAVPTFDILHAVRNSLNSWTDISFSSFEFEDGPVPFDHSFVKFPDQVIVPGAVGLDGWNLITFQDPTLSLGQGVLGMSTTWVFWEDFDLGSFFELPPGVIFADPPGSNPPGGGPPALVQIDFSQPPDGLSDVIIEARNYKAGEVIEGDTWLNQSEAWVVWPDDPDDLPTTPGGPLPPDTLGTLDIEGTVTHELGHMIGIAHTNIEKATMYWLHKSLPGSRYPTDVWDNRELDLDDGVAAGLIYPKSDPSRGTIAGQVLDGRNFDGLPDRDTSGVIDPILYGTVYVCRRMDESAIPAYEVDKWLFTTQTAGLTQRDLDTSPALWLVLLTEIQSGDNIRTAIWPNPASLDPNGSIGGQNAAIEATADYHIPGIPPFDQYIMLLDNSRVYYNDAAGQPTDNISVPFSSFAVYQPIPTEYYGGNMEVASRLVLGPDGATSLAVVTTQPLVLSGDDPTSYVYVAVEAGQITPDIIFYTNTGGLPPGVTPTPLPGITPTPPPPGSTRFAPDVFGDALVPQESEFAVASAVGDIDNDGDLDLYICNALSGLSGGGAPPASPVSLVNRIYLNDLVPQVYSTGTIMVRRFRDVTFGDDGVQGGTGKNKDRHPLHFDSSFGAIMGDFNLDGYLDIFVCNAETLTSPNGAQNRLYMNDPANPGWFDDWTAQARYDGATGIPRTFTATILPGILNTGPFVPYPDPVFINLLGQPLPADFNYLDWFDRASKPDVADIDSDGDLDIIIPTFNRFPDLLGTYSTATTDAFLFFSTRILINHTNDFDMTTMGFYFTDETLGLDCAFGEVLFTNQPTTSTWTNRQAADRMPPCYPDLPPTPAVEGELSRTYKVVMAPLFGDSSVDMVLYNISTGPRVRDGHDAMYENVDIDNDGVQDGYFRFVNANAAEYGYMYGTLANLTLTTWPSTLAISTATGTGGIGIFDGDPGDSPADSDVVAFVKNDALGGAAGDFQNHGFILPLAMDGSGGLVYQVALAVGCERGQAGVFGGESMVYSASGLWAVRTPGAVLPGYANLARDAIVADFDADGDNDVYGGFQKAGGQNTLGGPVINQYWTNQDFVTFTNDTALATSGSSRATYHVLAFDFELDGDLDVWQSNAQSQNALVLNRIFDGPVSLASSIDNPMFYDASPHFLPPFYWVAANPPFTVVAGSNVSISVSLGDLNGDDYPDAVVPAGALFTIVGDDTDVLLNKGPAQNAGATFLSPIHATWPGPKIASYEWLRLQNGIGESPFDSYRLNAYEPAYDAALADFDLDGDYDVVLSRLGTGPIVYSNEDSADLALAWNSFLTSRGFTERALNSIPDGDFLGDALLIPAGTQSFPTTGSLFILPPLRNLFPGLGANKKDLGRGLAIGDVDNNGSIDFVVGNGASRAGGGIAGAPNALVLNAVSGAPLGTFADATETHLPVEWHDTVLEGVNDDTMACALADFDSDGDLDLLFANIWDAGSSPTRYLENLGGGHFVDVPGFLPMGELLKRVAPWKILVADFDMRGDPTEDINGNGVLDPGEDVNHNGVLDWSDSTETEDINGNGMLDPGEDGLAPFWPPNGLLDVRDLNGDGEILARQPGHFDASWDIFITFEDGPDLMLVNSLPAPTFYFREKRNDGGDWVPLVMAGSYGGDIGDVDLDGDIDIVVGVSSNSPTAGRAILYVNQLFDPNPDKPVGLSFRMAVNEIPRAYSIASAPGTPDVFQSIALDIDLADLDQDGDLDMYIAFSGLPQPATMGGLNAVYMNRLIGTSWNSLNRFRTYRAPFLVKNDQSSIRRPEPTLLRLQPTSGHRGRQVTLILSGKNLEAASFGQAAILDVNLGEGITLASPIVRLAPDVYSFDVEIDGGAPLGSRDVTAFTNDSPPKMLQMFDAFTVLVTDTAASPSWVRYQ